jgi:hypothetical protein
MSQSLIERRLLRYQRRLEALKREKAIYKYALDHVGEKVIKTKLLRRFKYSTYNSNSEGFKNSRLIKYVREEATTVYDAGKRFPIQLYKRSFRDVIWLSADLVDKHHITTIGSRYPKWGYKLCFKETVPFWLLKQYGGPYSGREFITEINKRIRQTKKDIEVLNGNLH